MAQRQKRPLVDRVADAAAAALAERDYVSAVAVLLRIGWLQGSWFLDWQQGRIACLEEGMQVDAARLRTALNLLRDWAREKGLRPSETEYVARTPQRPPLRFSRSGDATTEHAYRTHWLSSELPEKRRRAVAEKASRPPELVAVVPLHEWKCHRCGGTGDFLMMENGGPACLPCLGLGDLEFLGAGDALLTRRAKAKSRRFAVVVRFSRSRRRYERQGLLVEPKALAAAEDEVEKERQGDR